MLDHVTIGVSNLTRARKFYDYALKPLGIERLFLLNGRLRALPDDCSSTRRMPAARSSNP